MNPSAPSALPRVLGTDGVEPADRLEYWRQTVTRAFVPLSATAADATGFTGRLQVSTLGTMTVSRVSAAPHTVRRSKSLIADSERGLYKLGLQLSGVALLVQDGREAVLGSGDFALYDTDLPYTLDFGAPTDMAVFMFPRERLHLPLNADRDILARRIGGRDDVGALVTPLLIRLVEQQHRGGLHATPVIADAVVDLLSALLADDFGTPESLPHQALLVQAKAFIDDHLGDPDLTPDVVAAAVHISTRYLQKLFSADGRPVASWIRQRRLDQCRRELSSARAIPSISAVGRKCGFPDPAHFSRVFKAQFGISPGEFRRTTLSSPNGV
ncbi:helix-turn-helix domain-containing protein [Nocardia abscessus]|uniref:AraC-like ligand-binding domain-containing protein n=1 Tax=Nocardia abscessus TaxID=120957 RepID=UPI0024557E0A|nr:helix-turn-helix domain-containing protein [Nocardia abscessus]